MLVRLFDVLPRLPEHDMADRFWRHTILSGNLFPRHAANHSNSPYISVCQLGVLASLTMRMAALFDLIINVVLVRADEQMCRVKAAGVIAPMTHMKWGIHVETHPQMCRQTVCMALPALKPRSSVTTAIVATIPVPTTGHRIYITVFQQPT